MKELSKFRNSLLVLALTLISFLSFSLTNYTDGDLEEHMKATIIRASLELSVSNRVSIYQGDVLLDADRTALNEQILAFSELTSTNTAFVTNYLLTNKSYTEAEITEAAVKVFNQSKLVVEGADASQNTIIVLLTVGNIFIGVDATGKEIVEAKTIITVLSKDALVCATTNLSALANVKAFENNGAIYLNLADEVLPILKGCLDNDELAQLQIDPEIIQLANEKAKELSDLTGGLFYGLMYCSECEDKGAVSIIPKENGFVITKTNIKCFLAFYKDGLGMTADDLASNEEAFIATPYLTLDNKIVLFGITNTEIKFVDCTSNLVSDLKEWDYCVDDVDEAIVEALFTSIEDCLVDNGLIEGDSENELDGIASAITSKLDQPISDLERIKVVLKNTNETRELRNTTQTGESDFVIYYEKDEEGNWEVRLDVSQNYIRGLGLKLQDQKLIEQLIGYLEELVKMSMIKFCEPNQLGPNCSSKPIEFLQVINLHIQNLAKQGMLHPAMWDREDPKYDLIPNSYRIVAIPSGALDGVIEDVLSIPLLIKMIGESWLDDESQLDPLLNLFTVEGASKALEAIADDVKKSWTNEDKREHGVTKVTVELAMIYFSWAGKSAKVLKETLEQANQLSIKLANKPKLRKYLDELIAAENKLGIQKISKLIDDLNLDPKVLEAILSKVDNANLDKILNDLVDSKPLRDAFNITPQLIDAWETIIGNPMIRKDVKALESISKIIDNTNLSNIIPKTDLSNIVNKLAQKGVKCRTCTGGNSAYKYLDEILDDIEFGAVKYGSEYTSVLTGFKQGGNFAEGAMFVASSLKKYPNDFPSNTIFEFTTKTTADNIRRVDVKVPGAYNGLDVFYEFKSVTTNGMPPNGFANQFVKDLDLPDVTNLNQLKWWFDGGKVSSLSKADFISSIQSATINQNIINKLVKTGPKTKQALVNLIDSNFDIIFIIK